MALREVLEQVRLDISAGHANRANEQEAKEWFITPILQALDWKGPGRVRLEHPAGRERVKMDFALQGPNRESVALIEAKAPGSDLSDHVGQVLGYAFHEGVDICVLTTGVEWWLYLPREKGAPSARRFAELDVRSDNFDDLESTLMSCLGYGALTSGEAEQHARTILAARQDEERLRTEIPRVWQQMVDEPDRDLVQLVANRVFRALQLHPSPEQIAAVLRGDVLPPLPRPPNPPRTKAKRDAPKVERDASKAERDAEIVRLHDEGMTFAKIGEHFGISGVRTRKIYMRETSARLGVEPSTPERRRRRTGRRITGYRLWGIDHETNTWRGMLSGVAVEVYRKHPDEFHQALSLHGRFRQYVATTADNMRRPVAIPDSQYFIETSANRDLATQWAQQLLTMFGHEADDLEILYEQ